MITQCRNLISRLSNRLLAVAAAFCFIVHVDDPVHAQNTDARREQSVEVLLDSMAYFKMRDPVATLRIGEEVLRRIQDQKMAESRFRALIECANAEKIGFKTSNPGWLHWKIG